MRIKIAEGQVWRTKTTFRRVIDVRVHPLRKLRHFTNGTELKVGVTYSAGGNHNHFCLRTTFLRWRSDNDAVLSRGAHAKKRKRDKLGRFV